MRSKKLPERCQIAADMRHRVPPVSHVPPPLAPSDYAVCMERHRKHLLSSHARRARLRAAGLAL